MFFFSLLGFNFRQLVVTQQFARTHAHARARVQVFAKRSNLDVGQYAAEIERVRQVLELKVPNVETFQTTLVKDTVCFLTRPYYASNLYDRLATRPFLSDPEKRWIAFQLLQVRTCRRVAR